MTVLEVYDAAQVQDVLAKVSQAKADTLPFLHVLAIYGPVLVSAAEQYVKAQVFQPSPGPPHCEGWFVAVDLSG